jgi:hypothetical protein
MPKISVMGVPWCRREDYREIIAVMADGERLPKF